MSKETSIIELHDAIEQRINRISGGSALIPIREALASIKSGAENTEELFYDIVFKLNQISQPTQGRTRIVSAINDLVHAQFATDSGVFNGERLVITEDILYMNGPEISDLFNVDDVVFTEEIDGKTVITGIELSQHQLDEFDNTLELEVGMYFKFDEQLELNLVPKLESQLIDSQSSVVGNQIIRDQLIITEEILALNNEFINTVLFEGDVVYGNGNLPGAFEIQSIETSQRHLDAWADHGSIEDEDVPQLGQIIELEDNFIIILKVNEALQESDVKSSEKLEIIDEDGIKSDLTDEQRLELKTNIEQLLDKSKTETLTETENLMIKASPEEQKQAEDDMAAILNKNKPVEIDAKSLSEDQKKVTATAFSGKKRKITKTLLKKNPELLTMTDLKLGHEIYVHNNIITAYVLSTDHALDSTEKVGGVRILNTPIKIK